MKPTFNKPKIRKKRPSQNIDVDLMMSMLARGMTHAKVAKHFGVTRAAITNRKSAVMRSMSPPDRPVPSDLNPLSQLKRIVRMTNELVSKVDRRMAIHDRLEDIIPLHIALAKEVRDEIDLMRSISLDLHNAQAVAEFQVAVLDTLAQADPELREKAIRLLKRKASDFEFIWSVNADTIDSRENRPAEGEDVT